MNVKKLVQQMLAVCMAVGMVMTVGQSVFSATGNQQMEAADYGDFEVGKVIVGLKNSEVPMQAFDGMSDEALCQEMQASGVQVYGTDAVRITGAEILMRFSGSQNQPYARNERLSGLAEIQIEGQEKQDVLDAIEVLEQNPNVAFAEPSGYYTLADTVPNDPDYGLLYGMENISAPMVWDECTGSNEVVVAVIDTGIDYNHEDLAANMWNNPGEIPGNGVDDDGNGYVDDVYGWDFGRNTNDPIDAQGHGTHCAGIIGAVGDNGIGTVGVCWNVKLAALRIADENNKLPTSAAIDAIDYANQMDIPIISASWGNNVSSLGLGIAIQKYNGLFIAGAGNDGKNEVYYPARYNYKNLISVTSIDNKNALSSFSNYDEADVHIGAPGTGVYSCLPNNEYGYKSGTSMATPHVAGAAALLKAYEPDLSPIQIKQRILNGAIRTPALEGKVSTGGRLNVYNALFMPGFAPEDIQLSYENSKCVLRWGADYNADEFEIMINEDGNILKTTDRLYPFYFDEEIKGKQYNMKIRSKDNQTNTYSEWKKVGIQLCPYGDANEDGKVDMADATRVSQSLKGLVTLTESQRILADVDGDGNITENDFQLLMEYSVKIIKEFPIGKFVIKNSNEVWNNVSDYTILPYGDANEDGKVDAVDVTRVSQALNGLVTLTQKQKLLADVDGDGNITPWDHYLLMDYSVNKITEFPVGDNVIFL